MLALADATWTEVRDADIALALLPVGSTEQHGPHAPLGTDTMLARAIARSAANTASEDADDSSAVDGELAVAPALPIGIAAEHRAFDGTLHVPPDAFRAYVRGTVESLRDAVDAPIIVVNGHGGNTAALTEVAARCTRAGDHRVVAHTWFETLDRYPEGMGHAGPVETAVLRALDPDQVRGEEAADAGDGAADTWGEWVSGTNLEPDADAFTDNGVVGDPDATTAADGEALLAEATDALVDLIAAVADRDAT
jgi:creatinine amidohydrolase